MNKEITYIFRKRLPQYNSIEELFSSIEGEISKTNRTKKVEVEHSGATPLVILKNLLEFKKNKNELYHITGDVHYMALRTGRNTILTIHDVKSATNGHLLKQLYIRLFWFWLPAIFVKRITVISEFTRSELEKTILFAKHKIRVVHNPVNSKLNPNPYIFNEVKPTILFIGTKPNKNLERSFKALQDFHCKVKIIGKISNSQLNLLKELDIDFETETNLNFDEIIDCYQNCDLLCFASTYEGFGMPIIEAQAIGRPVITSEIGAMLEVAEDSACWVDPYDVSSIRQGVEKVCRDKQFREALVQKGFENVQRFQVANIAKDYLNIYDEVLD